MFHIESTAQCPRTPVLLLGLVEASVGFEIEIRPDGWFEQNHGEAGPRFTGPDGVRIGLAAVLDTVQTLPGLVPPSADEAERANAWFPKLTAVRAVMPRLIAAKRAGQVPADADVAVATQFVADLETSLETRPWLAGETFSSADVALSFVGFFVRLGLAFGPRTADWLARVHARPSWREVVQRFPFAATL